MAAASEPRVAVEELVQKTSEWLVAAALMVVVGKRMQGAVTASLAGSEEVAVAAVERESINLTVSGGRSPVAYREGLVRLGLMGSAPMAP